ncbi:MAG: hypothetical protein ABL911_02980 [Gallionella sp.]|nr:hypothetical protein [Gallionella sp.]
MQSPIHTSATIKLCISIIAFTVLTLSGCGGGGGGETTPNNTVQMGGARQGIPLNVNTASTFAGTPGGVGGAHDDSGAAAIFYYPQGLTSDGTNLYVADTYNHTIRKIVIATAAVTTLAGFAGTPGVSGSTNGTGNTARFWLPQALTTDGINLYVADTNNHTIRKVVIATGQVTTLAGLAGTSGESDSTDGTGATARFDSPAGITTDNTNLYVSDSLNHTIRKVVIATGETTTFAGLADTPGSSDDVRELATFNHPTSLTTDGSSLYVLDTGNHTIRKIAIGTGNVTLLAGMVGTQGALDGIGTSASFDTPEGITTDGANLFVVDNGSHIIRKVVIATRAVTTIMGVEGKIGSANGIGALATFNRPYGIASDGTRLYVADTYNHTIRKIQ